MTPDRADFDDGPLHGEDDLPERPYGAKPYGAKPYGAKPYGAKPYGAKPYGAKPYGAKQGGTGVLDPEEWSADVAELVHERSAVMRIGATLVTHGHGDVAVAAFDPAADYRGPGADPGPPGGVAQEEELRPRDFTLVAGVAVRDGLLRAVAGSPQLAFALKLDLAEALARGADSAFLGPGGGVAPDGVEALAAKASNVADLLRRVRAVVTAVRKAAPVFRSPGWVLHPETVTELTGIRTRTGLEGSNEAAARTIDTFPGLLELDGADGGKLLGFPFVASAAAIRGNQRRLFFAADWEEAWIAVDRELVTVEFSTEGAGPGQTVIRGAMWHDFTLRRPGGFAWAQG